MIRGANIRCDTCAECWIYSDTSLIDCGVFGDRELCEPCRVEYAPRRPVLATGSAKIFYQSDRRPDDG